MINEITIYNKTYPLKDTCFQTVNPNNPAELLAEEKEVMDKLLLSFQHQKNKTSYVFPYAKRKIISSI